MSEETNAPESEGTWSGLKKTLIGTLTTVILGGGTYLSTTLFGGHDEAKTETAAPAPAPVINITNSNAQQSGGTNTIIKEKTTVVEKAAPAKEEKPTKKSETEDAPW